MRYIYAALAGIPVECTCEKPGQHNGWHCPRMRLLRVLRNIESKETKGPSQTPNPRCVKRGDASYGWWVCKNGEWRVYADQLGKEVFGGDDDDDEGGAEEGQQQDVPAEALYAIWDEE